MSLKNPFSCLDISSDILANHIFHLQNCRQLNGFSMIMFAYTIFVFDIRLQLDIDTDSDLMPCLALFKNC